MDRWVAKFVAFFVLFITMTIAGLLPIKVAGWYHSKGAKGEFYISVLNCFGGGVFFGTYLMHIAPEVREILEDSLLIPNNISYPLPELAIGAGFFLLLFVDKFVTMIAHHGSKGTVEPDPLTSEGIPVSVIKHEHGYKADGHLSTSRAPSPRLVTRTHHDSVSSNVAHDLHHQNGGTVNGHVNEAMEHDTKLSTVSIGQDVEKKELEAAAISTEDQELAARPYIFLVALSIDCIFEGLTLGLQDDAYGVWMLVIAILSHELVITFSFGLRLVRLFSTKKVIAIIVFYASTIPIGILIGILIYETGGNTNTIDIVSGFFQAIAGGIFIYITFLEILNEELTHDAYLSKPVAVLVGFLFMALMVLVENIENPEDPVEPIVNTTASFLLQNV